MPRLFTALEIPRDAAFRFPCCAAACPAPAGSTSKTITSHLRFFGDIEGHVADEIANALDRVRRPTFQLRLAGVGAFGGKKPHSVWAGVEASPDLTALQGEIERICQRFGVPADPRKFTPHVTLARLRNVQPDRCRRLSVGARQFFGHALQGGTFRADVVARFGRRRALRHRGGLAAGGRRSPPDRATPALRRLERLAVGSRYFACAVRILSAKAEKTPANR